MQVRRTRLTIHAHLMRIYFCGIANTTAKLQEREGHKAINMFDCFLHLTVTGNPRVQRKLLQHLQKHENCLTTLNSITLELHKELAQQRNLAF